MSSCWSGWAGSLRPGSVAVDPAGGATQKTVWSACQPRNTGRRWRPGGPHVGTRQGPSFNLLIWGNIFVSNLVRLMESLGAVPHLGNMSVEQYVAAMEEFDIQGPARQAVLDRDVRALCVLEQARSTMICMIATPNGEEEQDAPQQDDVSEPGEEQHEE